MRGRTNEFKTNTDRTTYARIRRDAVRAMGFCPECSNGLMQTHKARCNECAQKGKMRKYGSNN